MEREELEGVVMEIEHGMYERVELVDDDMEAEEEA